MFSFNSKFHYMIILITLILSLLIIHSSLSLAQDKYPRPPRAIELIIPFPPGAVTDISARIFADEMSKILGVPFTPINKGGASGTIGATYVMKAPRDGYTLMATTISGMVLAPIILPNVEYDTLRDFFPIGMISTTPHSIIVKADSPFKDLDMLIEAGRKNPGKISYGSAGVGTDGNFNAEIFASAANAKFKHVPFKGGGETAPALMGGHVDFVVSTPTNFIPLEKAGNLRFLAITGKVRMETLPLVPTVFELGLKGDFIENWVGFFAASKIPNYILDVLVSATEKVLKSKEFNERIKKTGSAVQFISPAEFKAKIETEKKIAREVAKKIEMMSQK